LYATRTIYLKLLDIISLSIRSDEYNGEAPHCSHLLVLEIYRLNLTTWTATYCDSLINTAFQN